MMAGRPPFEADNAGQLMQLHLTAPPTSPIAFNPEIPGALAEAVCRCIRKDAAERYATLEPVIDVLSD